jgi:hypothetical protein
MATSIRRALGRLKCSVLDELPYRRFHQRIPEYRRFLKEFQSVLPPVPSAVNPVYEIHMLCGHRDYDMGIWASWSLMRFLGSQARLVVHCDGSLTSADVEEWRRVIHGLELVPRQTANQVVGDRLGHTKHLRHWRDRYPTSPQLVDAHFFGDQPVVLLMDTDVLVFREPIALIEAFGRPGFAWCSDIRSCYSASHSVIEAATGRKLPDRLNSGLLVSPRFSQDHFLQLDWLLDKMNQTGEIDLHRYWACQTYYALMTSFWNVAEPLPASYVTSMSRTPVDADLRHFVGVPRVRFRYYKEGVVRLLDQIGLSVSIN